MSDIKNAPQAVDVEKSLLGSALLDEGVLDTVMERVTSDYFYSHQNSIIFEAIVSLYKSGKHVDLAILANRLRTIEKLVQIGGETYLCDLVTVVSTSSNVESYIEILRDKMKLRLLQDEANSIITSVQKPEIVAKDLLNTVEHRIFTINEGEKNNSPKPISSLMAPTFKMIEKMAKSGGITGVQTGFTRLDQCTTGFHPGELVIVAARPGMGKTAFCLSVTANAAIRVSDARPIALFSLEMPKEQLVQRMLCSEARVDLHKMRGGYLGKKDMESLSVSAGNLHKTSIYIDDTPAITPIEVRAKCRKIKQHEGDLGMIIIDYLQLMRSSEKTNSRQEEVGSISRTLKEISKELKTPIIALAQLSRATEQGGSTRPQLSHLRESGSIEQDADIVLFVHRESYYMTKDDIDFERASMIGEIIIGKQRNGALEDIPVAWTGKYTRFDNLDSNYTEEGVNF